MLKVTGGKGFALTFANGWTASVQFGTGNYCDNRNRSLYSEWITQSVIESADVRAGEAGSVNAEIAAWDADGKWYDFGSDTVKGWVSADEVAKFLAEIAGK
jgi:hypothetical protein